MTTMAAHLASIGLPVLLVLASSACHGAAVPTVLPPAASPFPAPPSTPPPATASAVGSSAPPLREPASTPDEGSAPFEVTVGSRRLRVSKVTAVFEKGGRGCRAGTRFDGGRQASTLDRTTFSLTIDSPAQRAGTFPCHLTIFDGPVVHAATAGCTATITKYGAVGAPIEGTFKAPLERGDSLATGRFAIERGEDGACVSASDP
jgi:hypothetical protein